MMKYLSGMMLVIFLIFVSIVNAETQLKSDGYKARLATSDFLHELIECVTYFSIVGAGFDTSEEQTNVNNDYQELAKDVAIFAYGLAKDIDMKTEVLTALTKRYGKEMGEKIKYNAANISILVEKHGEFCKNLVGNPTGRLVFWMTKHDEQS